METPPKIPEKGSSGCGILAMIGLLAKGSLLMFARCGDDAGRMAKMASAEAGHAKTALHAVNGGVVSAARTGEQAAVGIAKVEGTVGANIAKSEAQVAAKAEPAAATGGSSSTAKAIVNGARVYQHSGSSRAAGEKNEEKEKDDASAAR